MDMVKYGSRPLYIHDNLFAIADIHGEREKLENLLGKLKTLLKPADHLVFSGDLVDRGPDSIGVLRTIRDFRAKVHPNTYVIEGNHEQMMKSFVFGSLCDYAWIPNGGKTVLDQLGIEYGPHAKEDLLQILEEEDLVEFLRSFIPYYESEHIIVTHAPFDRTIVAMEGGLDDETAENLIDRMGNAIRWKFTSEELRIPEIKKFRICGHQYGHSKKARIFKECAFLDTGCGCKADAPLAAIQFPGKKVIYSDPLPPAEVSL